MASGRGPGPGNGRRALRYLEWCWDPDPSDTTFFTDFAYLLREDGHPVRALHDRHVEGLFPRATWLGLLKAAGFRIHSASRPGDDGEPDEVFVCLRS